MEQRRAEFRHGGGRAWPMDEKIKDLMLALLQVEAQHRQRIDSIWLEGATCRTSYLSRSSSMRHHP